MDTLLSFQIGDVRALISHWFDSFVFVPENIAQLGSLLVALLIAWFLGKHLRSLTVSVSEGHNFKPQTLAIIQHIGALAAPIVMMLLVWLMVAVFSQAEKPTYLLRTVASLVNAWVVINLATRFIKNTQLSSMITWIAWTLAAVTTLGLFDEAIKLLDSLAITFGTMRVSVLLLLKGGLVLIGLMWLAVSLSNVLEARISRNSSLTPSVQVLLSKLVKIALVVVAFLSALNAIGIDFTALTVFGGALGVGIGFGLQRIIANLISGLILLMDKSIKPGDVIAVGDTYGWIVSLGARYAAVKTRDGIDFLIPNEELIIQRVENWSHTDSAIRLRIPIGVSYNANLSLAMDLCLQASRAVPRVLSTPDPRCLLRGFGDSSVDLEIRIWINDPANGRANVISDVLLLVWKLFHENDIEIPFPQRDLHLRTVTGNASQIDTRRLTPCEPDS